MQVAEKHDLWRYQNERDEARRLQISRSSRRMKKEMDSQNLVSIESCGSRRRDESGVSEKDAGCARGDG